MRILKGIELYFENCELSDMLSVGDIDTDDVNMLNISNVQRNICTVAVNAACEISIAEKTEITLNPRANRKTRMCGETGEYLFDRLMKPNSITSLFLHWDDGKEERISVPWGGESDYKNDCQTVTMLDNGCININISTDPPPKGSGIEEQAGYPYTGLLPTPEGTGFSPYNIGGCIL